MEFKVLGPPVLTGSGPRDIRLFPQLWTVLASLLLAEGKPVPVDSLADHLWGWNPPPMATPTIRSYVSRINAPLAQDGIRITRQAHGYQLSVEPEAVDLHKFRSLRRQAESVAESGDLGHAVALLVQADGMWRGPALMGLTGEWASARRRALDDERHEAVKFRIGIELDRGRQANVLGELWELSERHPFDEEIIRALMITLYRLGRQKDAIEIGRDVSERFSEVGMEVSPQLRDVHVRILRGDAALGVTPAYRGTGQAGQPNTLPPEAADFVGRAKEVELLTADCHGNAPVLWAIEGMAGVGKTTLAVHAAHQMIARYPDAQLFVQFPQDGLGAAAEALHRLLRMLGVSAARIPAETRERASLWNTELAHRRVVIVLDDPPGPDEIAPIIPVSGDSLVIATSRHHAKWPGQRVLRLEPLEVRDSVALLQRSAGPTADQDAEKVAEVARLCGGLPLAIRVAAGKLRDGDLDDLDSLIGELADVHAGRANDTEAGRRIFSAFEFTYRQLTARDKRIFRILGAAPCADFSLDTAVALMGEDTESTAGGITALCERYLLERASDDRFRFHSLIRSYAAALSCQEGSDSECRRAIDRMIAHYSDTLSAATADDHQSPRLEGADPDGTDPDQSARFASIDSAHAWLEAEWRNVLRMARYAARHERHRQCADLTHSLAGFLHTAGYWSDAAAAHELALQACHLLGDPARIGQAALDLSAACRRTGDYNKAKRCGTAALAAYISVSDKGGQAAALDQLGYIYLSLGGTREALAHHQEAAELYHAVGDQSGMATAVMHAATALGALGRYAEETRHLDRALSLFQGAGDRRGEAMCLNNLGAVLDDKGMHRDAVAYYEKSIAIFQEIRGGRQNLALLDHNLGRVQQYKGNVDEAIGVYRRALAAYRVIGDLRLQAIALSDIGAAFAGKAGYSDALAHHGKSAQLAETIGDRIQFAVALCGMADAYRGSGSYGVAAQKYDEAHRLAAEIEVPYLSGKALYGMAETVLITQGVREAKIYLRQAHDIFAQLGVQEAAIVELRLHGLDSTAS